MVIPVIVAGAKQPYQALMRAGSSHVALRMSPDLGSVIDNWTGVSMIGCHLSLTLLPVPRTAH